MFRSASLFKWKSRANESSGQKCQWKGLKVPEKSQCTSHQINSCIVLDIIYINNIYSDIFLNIVFQA